MNLLPNYEEAFIATVKLADYCLNSFHLVGKDKAKVFNSALGFSRQDAGFLKKAILEALPKHKAFFVRGDQYGERYTVDVKIRNFGKEAVVRTGWIIKNDEVFPRLTSCYVK